MSLPPGQRPRLSIMLFMMIPMMSPLDAGILRVGLSLAGSAMFGFGHGAISICF